MIREFRGRNLNNEFSMESLSEMGVSQIARVNAAMIGAPYVREFTGLMIGIVAPDIGNAFTYNGRSIPGVIRVYIPFKSPPKEQLEIDVTKDLDKLYLCFPIYPFAGTNVDGGGQGNSYGMAYTPGAGDRVAVLMANADTKTAFWFGCVPSLPGMDSAPGSNSQTVGGQGGEDPDAGGQGGEDPDGENFTLPAGVSQDSEGSGKKVPRTLTYNMKETGLIRDPHRGPTPLTDHSVSSGMGKDVFAMMSKGDPKNNRLGHQITMVDDPRYSHLRFMTGEGNQFVMSDAIKAIYLNTKHGKNWMEFREDGTVDVYAEKSISFHAIEDINLHCGRDMNIDIGRDQNQRVKKTFKINIGEGYHVDITGDFKLQASGATEFTIGEGYKATVTGAINLKSTEATNIDSGGELNLKAVGDIKISSDAAVRTQAGAGAADEASAPDPVRYEPSPAQPTPEQYRSGERGSDDEVVAGRDGNRRRPTHEPFEDTPGPSSTTTYDSHPPTGEWNGGPTPVPGRVNNKGDPSPWGWENNNPGAVLNASRRYQGRAGKDGAMTRFQDMKYGFAGMSKAWDNNYRPGRTARQITCSYNPEPGRCEPYARQLAAAVGLPDENTPITEEQWKDPAFRFKWMKASSAWENGIPLKDWDKWFSAQDLSDGLAMEGYKMTGTPETQKPGDTVADSGGNDKTDTTTRGTQQKKPTKDPKGYREEQRKLIDQ